MHVNLVTENTDFLNVKALTIEDKVPCWMSLFSSLYPCFLPITPVIPVPVATRYVISVKKAHFTTDCSTTHHEDSFTSLSLKTTCKVKLLFNIKRNNCHPVKQRRLIFINQSYELLLVFCKIISKLNHVLK